MNNVEKVYQMLKLKPNFEDCLTSSCIFFRDVIPMESAPSADSDANAVVFNLGASVIWMDLEKVVNKPVLKMTSWLRMSWMDFRLKWNPEAYGGLTNIRLPASKVWVPDVEVSWDLVFR